MALVMPCSPPVRQFWADLAINLVSKDTDQTPYKTAPNRPGRRLRQVAAGFRSDHIGLAATIGPKPVPQAQPNCWVCTWPSHRHFEDDPETDSPRIGLRTKRWLLRLCLITAKILKDGPRGVGSTTPQVVVVPRAASEPHRTLRTYSNTNA